MKDYREDGRVLSRLFVPRRLMLGLKGLLGKEGKAKLPFCFFSVLQKRPHGYKYNECSSNLPPPVSLRWGWYQYLAIKYTVCRLSQTPLHVIWQCLFIRSGYFFVRNKDYLTYIPHEDDYSLIFRTCFIQFVEFSIHHSVHFY